MTDKTIVIKALNIELQHLKNKLYNLRFDITDGLRRNIVDASIEMWKEQAEEIEANIQQLESAIKTFEAIEGVTEEGIRNWVEEHFEIIMPTGLPKILRTFSRDVLHITPKGSNVRHLDKSPSKPEEG